MSHCIDHLKKWKRDRNFCGLGEQYANELDEWVGAVEKICKAEPDLTEEFIVEHFTAGAARPYIRCKIPEIKTKSLNYVIACLKHGETITGGDLEATIKGYKEGAGIVTKAKAKKDSESPSTPESLTIVKENPTPDNDVKPQDPGKTAATPQPSLAAQIAGANPAQIDLHKIPPCLGNGGCPKKKFRQDGTRSICGELNVEIVDLPDKICPYDRVADASKSIPAPANSSEIPNSSNNLEKPDSSSAAPKSPFKTGTQVRDGIAGEMFPVDRQQPDPVEIAKEKELTDAERRDKERTKREALAIELLNTYPGSVQVEVADLLRENKSWKTADVFYFGIEALTEKSGRRR